MLWEQGTSALKNCEKLFKANLILQLDRNAAQWSVLISYRKHCEKKKEESLVYLDCQIVHSSCSRHHNLHSSSY